MIQPFVRQVREFVRELQLPAEAGAYRRLDHAGLPAIDPGAETAMRAAMEWLCRAQDCSLSGDGGVAHHFSLEGGWSASYPETTGYIIPTFLDYAGVSEPAVAAVCRDRARRMLDWLVSIQFPGGGFQGGVMGAPPGEPVTFNTGQILLGLAAGVRELGEAYREPMIRAADWLVATQDSDGCWRRFPTRLAQPGEKTYEMHVAWGLFAAAEVSGRGEYIRAAVANVRWGLAQQQTNGWFSKCCLDDHTMPYSHTIGYALRAIVEAYLATGDAALLRAARRTADGALSALGTHGFLPGRLDEHWQGRVSWSCLTGSLQVACCWFLLHRVTGHEAYLAAALRVNSYVRRTLTMAGPDGIRGGVRGSFPVDGGYCQYKFPNWSAKFFVDSQLLELQNAGRLASDTGVPARRAPSVQTRSAS